VAALDAANTWLAGYTSRYVRKKHDTKHSKNNNKRQHITIDMAVNSIPVWINPISLTPKPSFIACFSINQGLHIQNNSGIAIGINWISHFIINPPSKT
jgi:hypothetical protein